MLVELSEEVSKNLEGFLLRTDLKGAEVDALIKVINSIRNDVSSLYEKKSIEQGSTKKKA